MCGLSGIVDFGPGTGLAEPLLAMHARIRHRGPDGEGFCVVDRDWRFVDAASASELRAAGAGSVRAAFAFRWLKIQDASERAAQPMASPDGRLRILFNGEIYNFRELRSELEGLGHRFRSASDTEVVLAAYRQWGVEMFGRLDGMWAILLLDLEARRLVMSRDRFGIKPLYYRLERGRLLVASEVKQLLAAGAPPAANMAAVKRFVRGARPATPEETFFESATALPAATYCEVDLQAALPALRFMPYWRLERADAGEADGRDIESACNRLDELLTHAVGEHMVAWAPVGILISGGLDSSLVAALSMPSYAQRGEQGTGFSMVLGAEGGALDESRHIDRIVSSCLFRGLTTEFTPEWLRERLGDITWAQEEPVAGIAVAGQYLTLELAGSSGARVVLDGQGADELFAGYPRHQIVYLRDCLRRNAWETLASETGALAARDPALLRHALVAAIRGRAPRAENSDFIRDEAPAPVAGPLSLDESLRRDVLSGNLRAVLALTDRNSMAHSVEARVPYVSRGIVEFAFGLPDRYKVGAGQRKRILRRLGARHVPAQIVNRRDRIGFGAPAHRWLMQDFAEDLRALAGSPVFAQSAAFDAPRLGRYVESFLSGGHRDAGTIWRLHAVDRWARAFSVTGI
jgi:asparagine synthase (glutamine-hydrolysing)